MFSAPFEWSIFKRFLSHQEVFKILHFSSVNSKKLDYSKNGAYFGKLLRKILTS